MKNIKCCKSIEDILQDNYTIAVALTYTFNDDNDIIDTTALYGKEISDMIWGYVDGGVYNYITRMLDCKCSIAESIAFNLDEFSKKIEADSKVLKSLMKI